MIGVSKMLLGTLAILGVAVSGQHLPFYDSCHAAGVPDAYPAWGSFDTVQVSTGEDYVLYYESFSPFVVDLKGAEGTIVDIHEIGFRFRDDNFFQTTAGNALTVDPDSWDYVCYELVVHAPANSQFSLNLDIAIGGVVVESAPQVIATTTDACDAAGIVDAYPAFDYFDTLQVAGAEPFEAYFVTNRDFNVMVSSARGDPLVHVKPVSFEETDAETLVAKGETGLVTPAGFSDVCYRITVYANPGDEYQLLLEPSVSTSGQDVSEEPVPTDPCTAAGIVDAFPAFDMIDTDQVSGSEPFVTYFVSGKPFNVFLATADEQFAQVFIQQVPILPGVDGVFVKTHDLGLISPPNGVDTCYKVSVFSLEGVQFELDIEPAPETADSPVDVLSFETKSSGFPVKAAVLGAVSGAGAMALVALVAVVVVKRQARKNAILP